MCPLELPELPRPARPRRRPGGPRLQSLTLELQTVTPILGGGPAARRLDELDIIRVPTLRGHLRFWWRALYGHAHASQGDEEGRKALAQAERELWGGMGVDGAEAQRSLVEVRVTQVQRDSARKDESPIQLSEAYALWPARGTRGGDPTAPRWKPGIRFSLELLAPEGEPLTQVEQALRAWILFGGYGSRVRRGCGGVTLVRPAEPARWLPASASRDELRRLFGSLPLFEPAPAGPSFDLPLLRGASLYRGGQPLTAIKAWLKALDWLREFRQGVTRSSDSTAPGQFARNPGEGNRAGRSNWPEADKLRRISKCFPERHTPRPEYSPEPAWPRAGFGLPILFHFKDDEPEKTPPTRKEPQGFELRWEDELGKPHDRLASPLIVKALPLADGRFEPIALWLERGYPEGKVVLVKKERAQPRSEASFDTLRAPGDRPLFQPLREARSLREAFFSWLESTHRAREA